MISRREMLLTSGTALAGLAALPSTFGRLADEPDSPLSVRPQPGEVARVLEVPLDHLTDFGRWRSEKRHFRGEVFEVPFLDLEGAVLWGATAMVMAEFFSVAGYRPKPPRSNA